MDPLDTLPKVAVVTGSNKGIGFGIVRNLCSQFDGIVYLTSRDTERGKNAVENLKQEGLSPAYHQLDVTDQNSIDNFASFIKETHGGIDVLVNNVGVIADSKDSKEKQVELTLRTNYIALKSICNALYPLLRPHARVVTVSSAAGHLQTMIPHEELRKKFSDPDLTEDALDQLMFDFKKAVKENNHVEKGWPACPYYIYAVSKIGASALTRIHHKRFLKDSREDIVINHVHPGYVRTDLTRNMGFLTVEEGAEAPTYAALLPKNCQSPKGEFIWRTKEIVDWVNGPLPGPY